MSYETYLGHITAYEREFGAWHRRVEKILKRYRADRPETDDTIKFNVLWSNVQTLKAATFARTPMPDVSRRFKDNDPAGRVAALLLERSLEFQVRHFRDYSATLQQVTYDRFLGGRGTAWIRYEMKSAEAGEEISEDAETDTPTGEQIEDENCPTDYVHWKDFGHQVARTWEEVNVVWRKVYLTKKQAEARFPKFDLPLDSSPDDNGREKRSDQDNIGKLALVYEIWDKETGNAVWLSESIGKIVDEQEDPLRLEEFFPCPPPLTATLTTDSLVPVPDFSLYQDQANELDTLADRIDGLIKMLMVKGVYDGSIQELARLFTEGQNGSLVAIKNWAAFAEKKGLGGAIDIVEILPIAQSLGEAYKAFDQVKQQIYELTGISDILRGQTAPSETATAQQIKNSYASLRLKVYQSEVEKFATRLLQLKAEVICEHFDVMTILKLACVEQLSQADQQLVPQALQMLKGGVTRSFRVEIETDSMAYQDEQQEKQDRMEFLQATGGMLNTMMQMAQESPILMPLGAEMLKYGVSGFRIGKSLEGTIDQAIEQIKQQAQQAAQNPQPNPEAIKAQADAQASQAKIQSDAQLKQMSEQAATQRQQMTIQAAAQKDAQDKAHEAQLAAIKAQNDHAMAQVQQDHEAMLEKIRADAEASRAIQLAQIQATAKQTELDRQEKLGIAKLESEERQAQLDRDAKILIAQIAAESAEKAAAQAAEQGADTEIAKDTGMSDVLAKLSKTMQAVADAQTKPRTIIRGPDGKATGIQ